MKKITIIFLLFLSFQFSAKAYQINGTIKNYNSAQVFLSSVYGDKLSILDSTFTDRDGRFELTLNEKLPKGMYRLFFAKDQKIDLLFNSENIVFESNVTDPVNQIQIKESIENKIYYEYLLRRNYDQYRLELLQPVLMYYPKTDAFFNTISEEFNSIQTGLVEFTKDLQFKNKDTYASLIIGMNQKPLLLATLNPAQQQLYLREHYFDHIKFDEPSLLQSNAITSSILSYLSLYQNQNLNKEQLEKEFMRAVDEILTHTQANIEIHNFVIEYLINGFENFGFNNVISHMADWLSNPENCDLPKGSSSLEDRLNTIKKLVPGNQAPNIIGLDVNGKLFNLQDVNSKFTLLIFWASWCPHCTEMMPELNDFLATHETPLEVVSISIDTSKTELINFEQTFNPPWKTLVDLNGWDGKAAIDYGIHATPTLFLLDKNKKIIANIDTIRELKKKLK